MPYETADAVKNPFEAARRKRERWASGEEETETTEFQDSQSASSWPSTTSGTALHQSELVEATVLNQPSELESERGQHTVEDVSPLSPRKDTGPDDTIDNYTGLVLENSVNTTSSSKICEIEVSDNGSESAQSTESSDGEDESDAWVACAGKLQYIMNSIDQTGHSILKEVRQPTSVPNIEQFALSVTELAESIENQCNEFKEICKTLFG